MSKKRTQPVRKKKAAARTKSTPATPFQISGLYMADCHATRATAQQNSPPPNQLKSMVAFYSGISKDGHQLQFDMTLNLEACHESLPGEAIRMRITHRLLVAVIDPDRCPKNQDELATFVGATAIRIVWPYWRAFVQEQSARMGFPPLILALLAPGIKPAYIKVDHSGDSAPYSEPTS